MIKENIAAGRQTEKILSRAKAELVQG